MTPPREPACLLVTGDRHGHPYVRAVLDRWVKRYGAPGLVVLGDAQGVDLQAHAWALSRGYDFVVHPAMWKQLGRQLAGPWRNLGMAQHLAQTPRAVCVGFPLGGPGTAGCLKLCDQAGMRTFEADREGRVARYTPPPF